MQIFQREGKGGEEKSPINRNVRLFPETGGGGRKWISHFPPIYSHFWLYLLLTSDSFPSLGFKRKFRQVSILVKIAT